MRLSNHAPVISFHKKQCRGKFMPAVANATLNVRINDSGQNPKQYHITMQTGMNDELKLGLLPPSLHNIRPRDDMLSIVYATYFPFSYAENRCTVIKAISDPDSTSTPNALTPT